MEVGRALLEDGGVVGGAAAVGEDGGARREILAALRRRFVSCRGLENFRERALVYIGGNTTGGPH
jgi:hypothetical protein